MEQGEKKNLPGQGSSELVNSEGQGTAAEDEAVPASPSEEQRLLQLQINAEATEQRMVTFRVETEIAELDARKAAAEAALAQSHQRTHALELQVGA